MELKRFFRRGQISALTIVHYEDGKVENILDILLNEG